MIRYIGGTALWKWIKDVKTPIYIFLITRFLMVFVVYTGVIMFFKSGAQYLQGPSNLISRRTATSRDTA